MSASARIGIFGGSFDPPHEGHLRLARRATEELSLDRLLILPAGEAPNKPLRPGGTSPEQRLRMSQIAFSGLPRCDVSDREIRRPGKSFSVLTVRELARECADAELFLLLGSDQFYSVQNWYCAAELFSLCTLAPAMRYATDTETALYAHAAFLRRRYGARCRILTLPPQELASSELRAVRPDGDLRIPAAVRDYIRENHLYEACL